MKCNSVIKHFLELEDYMYLPYSIRWHILLCKSCRKEILSLQKNLNKVKRSEPFEMPNDLSSVIMDRIFASPVLYKKNISSTKWLSAGSLIFLSIFMISFSDSFTWLRHHFKGDLEVPLNIVMGIIITLYIALFIGAHLDEAKKVLAYFDKEAH